MSRGITARLAAAGCVAAGAEAALLVAAAGDDAGRLEALLRRREAGEPLAWLTGWAGFCGLRVQVGPGVYVPRAQTEAMALRAAALLPAAGVGVDLCTGSGAVAKVLQDRRPRATVVATDMDPAAVACARANGVDALLGDLDGPLPPALRGRVDVLTAVVPYVPTGHLAFLPRDVLAYEPRGALHGGATGLDVLLGVVGCSTRWLRPGGALVLELGGDQAAAIAGTMRAAGFTAIAFGTDEEGDVRFAEGRAFPL